MKPSTNTIARLFDVTPAQVVAQFRKNARQLSSMADKAERTGKRVNGYTELELRRLAENAWRRVEGKEPIQ